MSVQLGCKRRVNFFVNWCYMSNKSETVDKSDTSQRRVYVLPTELVERIVAYQNEMQLQSEVEAARRLLDGALKSRDTSYLIMRRFQERLKGEKILTDIARDVLMGHPLITQITMGESHIVFVLKGGDKVVISDDGTAQIENNMGGRIDFDSEGVDITEIPF